MKEMLAVFFEAKYYCENCDSVCYLRDWYSVEEKGKYLRCECSDYEDED